MTENRANKILGLVHSGKSGHAEKAEMNKASAGGAKYFVTFVDDHTRYVFVYCLKSSDELLPVIKKFVAFAENQAGETLNAIRSVNGREYLSDGTRKGIKRQLSVRIHRNGYAERASRILMEMDRIIIVRSAVSDPLVAQFELRNR